MKSTRQFLALCQWYLSLSIMEVESGETEITRNKATTDEATEGGEESEQLVAKGNTSAPV